MLNNDGQSRSPHIGLCALQRCVAYKHDCATARAHARKSGKLVPSRPVEGKESAFIVPRFYNRLPQRKAPRVGNEHKLCLNSTEVKHLKYFIFISVILFTMRLEVSEQGYVK